jgi:hypothetical protein
LRTEELSCSGEGSGCGYEDGQGKAKERKKRKAGWPEDLSALWQGPLTGSQFWTSFDTKNKYFKMIFKFD